MQRTPLERLAVLAGWVFIADFASKEWALRFLSDNGDRFLAATRTANPDGEVRVSKETRDRSGADKVKAYGYSRATGEVCSGAVTFG